MLELTQIYSVFLSKPSLVCVCVCVCVRAYVRKYVRACLEVGGGVWNGWNPFAPVLEMITKFRVHTCYDTHLKAHVGTLCTPRCSIQNYQQCFLKL